MSPTRIDRLGMLEIGEEVIQSFFFFNLIKLISLRLSGPRDTYFKIMQLSKFFFLPVFIKNKNWFFRRREHCFRKNLKVQGSVIAIGKLEKHQWSVPDDF